MCKEIWLQRDGYAVGHISYNSTQGFVFICNDREPTKGAMIPL